MLSVIPIPAGYDSTHKVRAPKGNPCRGGGYGVEWAASRRASSHFWDYYPPLSFVAEVDGKIIGFIIGSMGGPQYSLPVSGWVTTMAVDPEYQRKGIGRALLKAFMGVCEISRIPSRMMIPRNEVFEKMLLELGFERGYLVDYVRKPK